MNSTISINKSSNKCIQIILSHVPFKDNSSRSLTFTKYSSENFIHYREVFEYLENKTGIHKRYFVLTIGKTNINYVNMFYNKNYESKIYEVKDNLTVFNVNIDINADKKILQYHKSILASINRQDFKKEALMELFKYTKLRFTSKNYILLDYYRILFSYKLFKDNVKKNDLLIIRNNLLNIIHNSEIVHTYDDLKFTHTTLNNYCHSIK